MIRNDFYIFAIIAIIAIITLVTISTLNIKHQVEEAAKSRAFNEHSRSMELYVQSVNECHRKWPRADAFEIHECALEMME